MIMAVKTSSTWRPKCAHSECTDASTIVGQCVKTSVALKRMSAGNGRVTKRATFISRPGNSARAIHGGVAAIMSGATTITSSRCWIMWTL